MGDLLNSKRKWFTEKEAAKYLNVHRSTLYRLRKKGKLPYYYVGNSIRYKIHDIDDMMDEHKVEAFH